MSRPLTIGCLAFLTVSGCGELFGDVVELPRAAAANMIANMPASANLMALPERFPNARMRSEITEVGVVWTYSLRNKDACRFTAHVKEESVVSSVVWTEIDDISSDGQGYLCTTVRIAGEESVAATIEGRPADQVAVEREMAAAVVGNMASVHKSVGDQMKAMGPEPADCAALPNSSAQAACNGDHSLRDPTERRN